MQIDIVNSSNQKVGAIDVSDDVFGGRVNGGLIWESVVHANAAERRGTHKTKNRANVSGSGKKPWRQKGTGRARAGMTSSPLWRGGGRIFPNSPDENFSHKLNRKMFRAGLSSILSQLAREERLAVVDSFTVDAPKTRLLTQKLKGMGLDNVLIITDTIDDNLHLSSRNLPHVNVVTVANTDPISLIRHDKVIVTRSAVAKIEELFA